MIRYRSDERLSTEEYIAFLRTSDLGAMYPKKNFHDRIRRLLIHAEVTITARDDAKLVGVCLGITDHAYFLFLTDLGVSRNYSGRGIGRALVRMAHETAGGTADITAVTWANRKALSLYRDCGLTPQAELVGAEATDWELFDVRSLAD